MPPLLALFLCCSFVAALLWLDYQKGKGQVSFALWLPTLWILYCASRPVSFWFSGTLSLDGDVESGNFIERQLVSVFIVLAVAILVKRRVRPAEIWANNKAVILLFVFMGISVLWSEYTLVSFKRWVKALCGLVMAFVVLTERNPYEAIAALLRRMVYVLIPFSAMLVKYFPHLGVSFGRWSGERMWVGVSQQKNGLGLLCMLSAFFLIWSWLSARQNRTPSVARWEKPATFIVFLVTLWLLRGPSNAYSATSIAVLAVGSSTLLALWLWQSRIRIIDRMIFWSTVSICGFFTGVAVLGGQTAGTSVAEFFGRETTFTGRTEIWQQLRPHVESSPFVGKGYGGFWMTRPIQVDVNQAHNGYLDVILETGAVGVILLAWALVAYFRKARREYGNAPNWAYFRVSFLVMLMLHNLTESSFLKASFVMWSMFLILAVVFPSASEQQLVVEEREEEQEAILGEEQQAPA